MTNSFSRLDQVLSEDVWIEQRTKNGNGLDEKFYVIY